MVVNFGQNLTPPIAQNAETLRAIFRTLTAASCPHSYNFHVHTVHSDGRLRPEQVMEQAIALGLQGLTITDHHSISGYRAAEEWLNWYHPTPHTFSAHPKLQLWTGTEVNAQLLNIEVHILCYAFNPEHWAMHPYLQSKATTGDAYQAANVIAAVHAAGGLAVLAHPARYRRSPADLIPAAASLGIDGVETYYAYNNPAPWQPSPKETQQVRELGEIYGLLHTCGTDTHGLSLVQRL